MHITATRKNNDTNQLVMDSILDFLPCETPDGWVKRAAENIDILLIDHAHCEKKAASTAIHLISHYPRHTVLLNKMSRLAREELRHFEQVIKIMTTRGVAFKNISSARYAQGLRAHVRTYEPARLTDLLIIGAFIEARSCERFHRAITVVDDELASFYQTLLSAEGRHFRDYLALAESLSGENSIDDRIAFFAEVEKDLILSPDPQFRFHSGTPEND